MQVVNLEFNKHRVMSDLFILCVKMKCLNNKLMFIEEELLCSVYPEVNCVIVLKQQGVILTKGLITEFRCAQFYYSW